MAWILAYSQSGNQSFWLDELHTSWTISGTWSELIERSAAGNQTPGYFLFIKVVDSTLGALGLTPERSLRLLSGLAWAVTAVFVARYQTRQLGIQPAVCCLFLGWLIFDRLQLFYATEARVYALAQLASLLGWLTVAEVSELSHLPKPSHPPKPSRPAEDFKSGAYNEAKSLNRWVIWSWISLILQPVAGISILAQAFVLFWVVQDKKRTALRCLMLFVLTLPIAWWSQEVWQRRQLWSAFAGEASLGRLWAIFPWASWFLPVILAVGARLFVFRGKTKGLRGDCKERFKSRSQRVFVWAAGAGITIASTWLSTWSQLAPLMHPRYLIFARLPLALFAVTAIVEVLRCMRPASRIEKLIPGVMAAAGLGLMIGVQGTLEQWRRGALVGSLRGEGWQQAVAFVNQRASQQDKIWCAASLIEQELAQLPLHAKQNEYLSFPLRGHYRINVAEQPRALIGGASEWLSQLSAAETQLPAHGHHWIVQRGTAEQLVQRLAKIELLQGKRIQIREAPRGFGRVAVTRIRLIDSPDSKD